MPSRIPLYLAALCTMISGVFIVLLAGVKFPADPYADQAGTTASNGDAMLFFALAVLFGLLALYLIYDYVRMSRSHRRREVKMARRVRSGSTDPQIHWTWPVLSAEEDRLRAARLRDTYPEPQGLQDPPDPSFARRRPA